MPEPHEPAPTEGEIAFPDLDEHRAFVEGSAARLAALRLKERGLGDLEDVVADMLDTTRALLRSVELLTMIANLSREAAAAARQREAAARAELARLRDGVR
jgi:DNA-binding FadR family transcriptional regulator